MSAPKSVIHYDPSVEWESFQGTPVSSEISKDIIYKKWSVFLCACPIPTPPPIHLSVRPSNVQRQVLCQAAGYSDEGDFSPHEAYGLHGRDRHETSIQVSSISVSGLRENMVMQQEGSDSGLLTLAEQSRKASWWG